MNNERERKALVEAYDAIVTYGLDSELTEWIDNHQVLALRMARVTVDLYPHKAPFEQGKLLAMRLDLLRKLGPEAERRADDWLPTLVPPPRPCLGK